MIIWPAQRKLIFRAANKTLLASLPDLAVLLVLSAVVRLARIAALGFVSHSKRRSPLPRRPCPALFYAGFSGGLTRQNPFDIFAAGWGIRANKRLTGFHISVPPHKQHIQIGFGHKVLLVPGQRICRREFSVKAARGSHNPCKNPRQADAWRGFLWRRVYCRRRALSLMVDQSVNFAALLLMLAITAC